MSDKGSVEAGKMSVEYVREAKSMADFIIHRVHRGPGDTVGAAIDRAERIYGAPSRWVHRLRYREIRDIPASAFFAIFNAYRAACDAADRSHENERAKQEARKSHADFIARTARLATALAIEDEEFHRDSIEAFSGIARAANDQAIGNAARGRPETARAGEGAGRGLGPGDPRRGLTTED